MPEHTPVPTPTRAVYGFVLYLSMKTIFIIYLLWAFIPDHILTSLNLTYVPQKYWALALPIQVIAALFVFALFIYPGLNLCLVPSFQDISSVTDSMSIFRCSYNKNGMKCSEKIHGTRWMNKKELCRIHSDQNLVEPYVMKNVAMERNYVYCDCGDLNKCFVNTKYLKFESIPPVYDMTLSEVNSILYS